MKNSGVNRKSIPVMAESVVMIATVGGGGGQQEKQSQQQRGLECSASWGGDGGGVQGMPVEALCFPADATTASSPAWFWAAVWL